MATKTIVSTQKKKRALDALERRFAVAKSEAQNEQVRNKRCVEVGGQGLKSLVAPSLEPLPVSTHSTAVKKDLEPESLTYSQLSRPVHDNLLSAVEILDKGKSAIDRILHELLQKGDSAQKYVQGSRGVKIDKWILLDNFVQGHSTSAAQLRALRGNSKRSRSHMSRKQLKKCGVLHLPEEFRKYEKFMPMHELWKDYVMQLLKNVGNNQVASCLLVADLHGAILRGVVNEILLICIKIGRKEETTDVIDYNVTYRMQSGFLRRGDGYHDP